MTILFWYKNFEQAGEHVVGWRVLGGAILHSLAAEVSISKFRFMVPLKTFRGTSILKEIHGVQNFEKYQRHTNYFGKGKLQVKECIDKCAQFLSILSNKLAIVATSYNPLSTDRAVACCCTEGSVHFILAAKLESSFICRQAFRFAEDAHLDGTEILVFETKFPLHSPKYQI